MDMRAILFVAALSGALAVQGAETLTGRVVNSSGSALSGAKVWLKSRPDTFDSTGADGRFSLDLASTSLPRILSRDMDGDAAIRLRGNRLEFTLDASRVVTVELLGIQGERVATLFAGRKEKGAHSIPLDAGRISVPAGRYVISLSRDGAEAHVPVTVEGAGRLSRLPSAMAASAPEARVFPAKRAAAADTLIVLRMGHEIKKTPLAGPASQALGDISLKVRTYRRDTSVVVKAGRRIEVYVPSDYKELYLLPVLYLLHGGGANETYWRANCKFLDSLNAYADRVNVQPMIIVTPSAGGNTNYGAYGKTADPFYADLTTDIRAYTESHYKVDTARASRAISGLSMGSMQTWNLTLFYPKLWGWSLPMSGGLYKSGGFSPSKFRSDVSGKVIDVAALNELKLFKVYVNPTDIAFGDTDTTCQLAESQGIKFERDFTTRTSGGHTDPFWNEVFRKYAPLLFK